MQDPDDHAPEDSRPHDGDAEQLSPRQEHEVARLLADARHTEPMPDQVVARLDAVLASLAAPEEAPETAPVAPVVDLAARRRTRRLRMLVAAAAVVAAGVALPSYLPGVTTSSDDAGSESAPAAASEDRDERTDQESVDGESADEKSADGEAGAGGGSGLSKVPSDGALPDTGIDGPGSLTGDQDGRYDAAKATGIRIRPDHFSTDVRRATTLPTAAMRSDPTARDVRRQLRAWPDAVTECVPDDASGTAYSATYGGRRGVLVVGPAVDGQRRYELFMCGDPEFTRSVVLPAD